MYTGSYNYRSLFRYLYIHFQVREGNTKMKVKNLQKPKSELNNLIVLICF